MLLSEGEKVHVIARRLFDSDLRRHFVGEVKAVKETSFRVQGYAFIFDAGTGKYVRRPDRRTRVISLVDASNVIVVLPPEVDLEQVRYEISYERRLMLTDDAGFQMDINEFNVSR